MISVTHLLHKDESVKEGFFFFFYMKLQLTKADQRNGNIKILMDDMNAVRLNNTGLKR